MTAAFISSPIYAKVGYPANHPLATARIGAVEALCAAMGWTGPAHPLLESPEADHALLKRFHEPDYLSALQRIEATGQVRPEDRERFGLGTLENPAFPGLWRRAATSVGGSVLASELAHRGQVAFHPAGGTHHGRAGRASGFCYFNDPVFAILRFLDLGRNRVLYVDLDAHHGDGVELAFADDPHVMTISLHEAGRWPFTGDTPDRGQGRAHNFALPRGLNDSEFDQVLARGVLPLARNFGPDALVLVMGADALRGDPLSGLNLSNGALWAAVEALVALAPAAVVLGGGGYNPWTLARAWAGMWARLTGQVIPDRLPVAAQAVLAGLDCDLVEPEDRDALWLTTIRDARNDGPIRPEIDAIIAAHVAILAAEEV